MILRLSRQFLLGWRGEEGCLPCSYSQTAACDAVIPRPSSLTDQAVSDAAFWWDPQWELSARASIGGLSTCPGLLTAWHLGSEKIARLKL